MQFPDGFDPSAAHQDFVDLHIHTFHSGDGQYSPEEIFKFAADVHISALAISDHDSVGAIPAAEDLARQKSIEFVPSIELTTEYDGRELHILGPYIEYSCRRLSEALDRISQERIEQARERTAILRKLVFPITYE
jgi:predicted metal-dependent phosphoesterase TrpH